MAPIKGLKGESLLVQIGDGATPTEVFAHDCLINAERGIQFSSDTTDDTLPDCDAPGSPGWKEVLKDGLSATVTGGGKLHTSSVADWYAWFDSDDSRNCRIKVDASAANGGGYWAGAFKLTQFEVTGERKQYATTSSTLVSSGPITWVDAT